MNYEHFDTKINMIVILYFHQKLGMIYLTALNSSQLAKMKM